MTDVFFYTGFTFFSILFYLPSFWARFAFSGSRFSIAKFWGVTAYNFIFMFIHMDFINTRNIPLVGEKDNSVIGWLSFFMLFAYSFSIPTPWERRRWFSRNQTHPGSISVQIEKNQTISLPKKSFLLLTMTKLLSSMHIYLLIIACAGFHTVIMMWIAIQFIDVGVMAARIATTSCFIILSICGLRYLPEKLRKI
ncbi:hypothetical protein NVV94_26060 [Pseudomonas sp. LS1212]|uniref:hypothetical protein n=1 Tax=Pseudomonas sp. LS1212 TaxID=2972478 RepID=UPI00215D42A1|nr:hypothetical protein [Pseudomonas sp. LS1212]UVJ43938.1 hypothetical protein NVV94_26060 [Pseudomonas sp. LS1212]